MKKGCAILVLGIGLATEACGGSYDVGFDGVPPGSTAGANAAGAGGSGVSSAGTKGDVEAAGSSSQAAGTGSIAAGGDDGGGITVEPPRCGFSPDLSEAEVAATPTASSQVIARRIQRFLDDNDVASSGALPTLPSAAWAEERAMAILDAHAADGSSAPGLARFLTGWLGLPVTADVTVPAVWSQRLVEPEATLSTLLADPGAEPHRFGILTEPELLARRGQITGRGVWLMKSLFCVDVPPSPPEVGAPANPKGVTRREKHESTVGAAACQSCHQLVDPAGFSLEHFDAAGNYRELDAGQQVDSSGVISQARLSFADFDELAPQLAESCEVARCLAQTMAKDAGAVPLAFTTAETNHIANAFADSGFRIRALVKAIVSSPTFLE